MAQAKRVMVDSETALMLIYAVSVQQITAEQARRFVLAKLTPEQLRNVLHALTPEPAEPGAPRRKPKPPRKTVK